MASMFARPIVSLVTSSLGQFIDGLNSDSFKMSMWAGNCTLTNVALKKDIFMRMGLPLLVETSRIQRMELLVPWASLKSKPVEVKLIGVGLQCSLCPISSQYSNLDEGTSKAQQIASFEESRIAAERELSQASSGMLQRLRDAVLKNVIVEITNLEVSINFPPMVARNPPSVLSLSISSIVLQNADSEWKEVRYMPPNSNMRKRAQVTDLRVSLKIGAHDKADIVLPVNLSTQLEVANGKEAQPPEAQTTMTATVSQVQCNLNYEHACALTMLFMFVEQHSFLMRFRKTRPEGTVASNPLQWFQYAGHCVVAIVREEKKKKLVARGMQKLEADYVAMHKCTVEEMGSVPITWHSSMSSRTKRYYDLLNVSFPAFQIIELRKLAYAQLGEELEQHYTPSDIRNAKEAATRAQATMLSGAIGSATRALWGIGSLVKNTATYVIPGGRKKTQMDVEILDSVGDDTGTASADGGESVQDVRDSNKDKAAPRHFALQFAGVSVSLSQSDQPITTAAVDAIAVDVVLQQGTLSGGFSSSASVGRIRVLDEVGRLPGTTREDPVLCTPALQKAVLLEYTQYPPKSDLSFQARLTALPLQVVAKTIWAVRIMQFISMPASVYGESLSTTARKSVQLERRERRRVSANPASFAAAVRRNNDEDEKAVGQQDGDEEELDDGTLSMKSRYIVEFDIGGPTIILPEDSGQTRQNALFIQLGNLKSKYDALSSLEASIKDTTIFLGVLQSGKLLKQGETILAPTSIKVDIRMPDDDSTVIDATVDEIAVNITPASLSTGQKIANSLMELNLQLQRLTEGVVMLGYAMGPVQYARGEVDAYGNVTFADDDATIEFSPCEIVVRGEGYGAQTVLQVTRHLGDAGEESVYIHMMGGTEVYTDHYSIDDPFVITIVVPRDNLPAEESNAFFRVHIRASNEDDKTKLVRVLQDSLAMWKAAQKPADMASPMLDERNKNATRLEAVLAVRQRIMRKRLEALRNRKSRMTLTTKEISVALAGNAAKQMERGRLKLSLKYAKMLRESAQDHVSYSCDGGEFELASVENVRRSIVRLGDANSFSVQLVQQWDPVAQRPIAYEVNSNLPMLYCSLDYDESPKDFAVVQRAMDLCKSNRSPKADQLVIVHLREWAAEHAKGASTTESQSEGPSRRSFSVKSSITWEGARASLQRSRFEQVVVEFPDAAASASYSRDGNLKVEASLRDASVTDMATGQRIVGVPSSSNEVVPLVHAFLELGNEDSPGLHIRTVFGSYSILVDPSTLKWIPSLCPSHYLPLPSSSVTLQPDVSKLPDETRTHVKQLSEGQSSQCSDSGERRSLLKLSSAYTAARRAQRDLQLEQQPASLSFFVNKVTREINANNSKMPAAIRPPHCYCCDCAAITLRVCDEVGGGYELRASSVAVRHELRAAEMYDDSFIKLPALVLLVDGSPPLLNGAHVELTAKGDHHAHVVVRGAQFALEELHIIKAVACVRSLSKIGSTLRQALDTAKPTATQQRIRPSLGQTRNVNISSLHMSNAGSNFDETLSTLKSPSFQLHRRASLVRGAGSMVSEQRARASCESTMGRALTSNGSQTMTRNSLQPLYAPPPPRSLECVVEDSSFYVGPNDNTLLDLYIKSLQASFVHAKFAVVKTCRIGVRRAAAHRTELPSWQDAALLIDQADPDKQLVSVAWKKTPEATEMAVEVCFPPPPLARINVSLSEGRRWAEALRRLDVESILKEVEAISAPHRSKNQKEDSSVNNSAEVTLVVEKSPMPRQRKQAYTLRNVPPIVVECASTTISIAVEPLLEYSASRTASTLNLSCLKVQVNQATLADVRSIAFSADEDGRDAHVESVDVSFSPASAKALRAAIDEYDVLSSDSFLHKSDVWYLPNCVFVLPAYHCVGEAPDAAASKGPEPPSPTLWSAFFTSSSLKLKKPGPDGRVISVPIDASLQILRLHDDCLTDSLSKNSSVVTKEDHVAIASSDHPLIDGATVVEITPDTSPYVLYYARSEGVVIDGPQVLDVVRRIQALQKARDSPSDKGKPPRASKKKSHPSNDSTVEVSPDPEIPPGASAVSPNALNSIAPPEVVPPIKFVLDCLAVHLRTDEHVEATADASVHQLYAAVVVLEEPLSHNTFELKIPDISLKVCDGSSCQCGVRIVATRPPMGPLQIDVSQPSSCCVRVLPTAANRCWTAVSAILSHIPTVRSVQAALPSPAPPAALPPRLKGSLGPFSATLLESLDHPVLAIEVSAIVFESDLPPDRAGLLQRERRVYHVAVATLEARDLSGQLAKTLLQVDSFSLQYTLNGPPQVPSSTTMVHTDAADTAPFSEDTSPLGAAVATELPPSLRVSVESCCFTCEEPLPLVNVCSFARSAAFGASASGAALLPLVFTRSFNEQARDEYLSSFSKVPLYIDAEVQQLTLTLGQLQLAVQLVSLHTAGVTSTSLHTDSISVSLLRTLSNVNLANLLIQLKTSTTSHLCSALASASPASTLRRQYSVSSETSLGVTEDGNQNAPTYDLIVEKKQSLSLSINSFSGSTSYEEDRQLLQDILVAFMAPLSSYSKSSAAPSAEAPPLLIPELVEEQDEHIAVKTLLALEVSLGSGIFMASYLQQPIQANLRSTEAGAQLHWTDHHCLTSGTLRPSQPIKDGSSSESSPPSDVPPMLSLFKTACVRRIAFEVRHHNERVLSYDATDVLDISIKAAALRRKETYMISGHLGSIAVFVTPKIMDLMKEASTPASTPVSAEEAEAFPRTPQLRRNTAEPAADSILTKRLPRFFMNIIGPNVNISVLDEALLSVNLTQCALECTRGTLDSSKGKIALSAELQPIVRLGEAVATADPSVSPSRWAQSHTVSPIAWLDVSAEFSRTQCAVHVGPVALDTTTAIPNCVLALLRKTLPRNVVHLLQSHPQQIMLSSLSLVTRYNMASPSHTILHNAELTMDSMTVALEIDMPWLLPHTSLYFDLQGLQVELDDEAGATILLAHLDTAADIHSFPIACSSCHSVSQTPQAKFEALSAFEQERHEVYCEAHQLMSAKRFAQTALHSIDAVQLYKTCVTDRNLNVRVHRILFAVDPCDTAGEYHSSLRHPSGEQFILCAGVFDVQSNLSTVHTELIHVSFVQSRLKNFVGDIKREAVGVSDMEDVDWGAGIEGLCLGSTSTLLSHVHIKDVAWNLKKSYIKTESVVVDVDTNIAHDALVYVTWEKCWRLSRYSATDSVYAAIRPINTSEKAWMAWRHTFSATVRMLRHRTDPKYQGSKEFTDLLVQELRNEESRSLSETYRSQRVSALRRNKYLEGFARYLPLQQAYEMIEDAYSARYSSMNIAFPKPFALTLRTADAGEAPSATVDATSEPSARMPIIQAASIESCRLSARTAHKERFVVSVVSLIYEKKAADQGGRVLCAVQDRSRR